MRRAWLSLLAVPLTTLTISAADDDFRTVETAVTAKIQPTATPTPATVPGFLGVQVEPGPKGQPVVEDVQSDSPGARAGVKSGDLISRFDGKEVTTVDAFRTALHAKAAGDTVKLTITRQDKSVELSARLVPVSKPMPPGRTGPAPLGVQLTPVKEGEGLTIESITAGSQAERIKLKVGETILKVDETSLNDPEKFREVMASKKADDTVTLTLLVAEKKVEMKVKLEADRPMGGRGGGGFGGGGGWNRSRYWTKPAYKIAIILVEYPDAKHNKTITPKAWEEAMFSHDRIYKKTITGQDHP